MATTPEVITDLTAIAAASPRGGRDRRVTIFRVFGTIVSLGLLFGAMILFFLLAPWTVIGPEPAGYTAEIHRWHHADTGALFGFLVSGSLLAAVWAPRQRVVLVQAALIALGAMLLMTSLDALSIAGLAVPAIVMGIIVAAFPAPRALFTLRRDSRPILSLLALTAVVAVPLLLDAVANVRLQLTDHSQHATEGHWGGSAAVAIALVLAGLLVALRQPGWQALGLLVAATWGYLGVAALTIPDHDGSWGVIGGGLALAVAVAWLVLVLRERRVTPNVARG